MPEPVAFYPLNARYKAAEKENRQPEGILGDVAITNGPYNEPGGAYMFYGTVSSYIEFLNNSGLDTQFSITLMCWVEPGGQGGPLIKYESHRRAIGLWIESGKLSYQIDLKRGSSVNGTTFFCSEIFPARKWVHVAASYDHNTGNYNLYIDGHLRASHHIGTGYWTTNDALRIRMGSILGERDHFKGKIANLKVFDVALDEAQIQTSIRSGSSTFSVIVVSLPLRLFP